MAAVAIIFTKTRGEQQISALTFWHLHRKLDPPLQAIELLESDDALVLQAPDDNARSDAELAGEGFDFGRG